MDVNPSRDTFEAGLGALPADIIYIILAYLNTAKSVANLAATCKGLHNLVSGDGWRIFVTSCFNSFTLSDVSSADEWRERARSMTSQSRDWDRRAFVVDILKPPTKHSSRNFRRFHNTQSIPSNIIVDAHHRRTGNDAQDLVFWGAGEDIFGLLRHNMGTEPLIDEWFGRKGSMDGYSSGKDDVTCASILKESKYHYGQGDSPQVLVGRASGHLRLLRMDPRDFGHSLLNFRALDTLESQPNNEATSQLEIQALDINYGRGLFAAATKQNILTYPLSCDQQTAPDGSGESSKEPPSVWASEIFAMKEDARRPEAFEYIRSVKFVNHDTLAVGLNKGCNPLQYLKYTPTGVRVSYAAKMDNGKCATYESNRMRTVRALLPVDTSSVAGGSSNTLLSTWDDGTIRLQDFRTSSPIDMTYQDNFEVSPPVNALISRGLERFVAGSAYSPVLKVFDYRWPRGYYHTEALSCGNDTPHPLPRHPTVEAGPILPDSGARCRHETSTWCRWHALGRHDFYRPNFNMWLPIEAGNSSPVYSLASPSDESPTLFAGLSGNLVEMTCKSATWPERRNNVRSVTQDLTYKRLSGGVAFIETGAGFMIDDVSQSQRVPPMIRQNRTFSPERAELLEWQKRHRLDEWLQHAF
ncbi:hypothetical protein GGR54DRAFT_374679 [Hypoxylon sp. NC1633]|nr:hypothetical protein GGR54DRAFT_374679 [Hypoxylon sp. NC1633]